ncbi:N-acetylglucosamine kinase [Gandjariella thermophila]|uniref:N-acetylglucosamine kinase n=1 Tax=Gandjariella thermophila TaxID=1931992 RepID=A0A4D4J8H1_9PSEU|nr:BadF/BadG/BcrA/BcrD ATPase family protein [Gandjariella thermophila]GDY30267.1 N-acetylglucosamine kinase [Gandjariella thermophila]
MSAQDGRVVGVDVGGTSTRALLAGVDGSRLGTGTAGGANPNSHRPEEAAERITTALRAALAGADPGTVSAGVVGMAGSSRLADPRVAELFDAAWRRAGLRCPMRVVADYEAAFAAGTAEPDGTALVAGTGSVAARIENRRRVATAGGYGWLLGDEGSAFWLGREAVRVALRALESAAPPGALATAVLGAVLGEAPAAGGPDAARRQFAALISAINGEPPIRLARLAPLVSRAVAEGDPAAAAVVAEAARLLTDAAMAVRRDGETTPVVLIGSLVGPASPVGERLRAELAARCSGPVYVADDGAAGAAWLAAVDLAGPAAGRPIRCGDAAGPDGRRAASGAAPTSSP